MMKFITLLAFFFAASTSLAKDKTAEPEMYMMKAEVVLKMNDQERTEYFEALREFMAANSDKIPGVSQMLIDSLLGEQVAMAADNLRLPPECIKGDEIQSGSVDNWACYSWFRSAARGGVLGECSGAVAEGKFSVITCGGKTYRLPRPSERDARTQAQDMNSGWVPASRDAAAKRQQTANPAPGTSPSGRPEPAAAPGANPNDPYHNRDAGNSARCFFGGFAIARDGNKPCSPFQDLCAPNLRMRGPKSDLLKEVMKCSTDEEKKKARCGGATAPAPTGGATIKRSRAAGGNQIVCNPVLYGLKDDGSVICVPRSGQASQKCAAEAKDDAIKKLLQDAKGKLAFDSMLATLTFECRTHWRIENPGDVEQASVVARSGNGESRDGDKSTTDFKDTCKTLVDRVIQIGRKIPEVKDNPTFKTMMSAFGNTSAAGNRPPAPGTR